MIGELIAARFIAKRPWQMSFIFWIILLIIGFVLPMIVVLDPLLWWIYVIIGFAIFIGLAIAYLKVAPMMAIIMYVVALIINLLIGYFLGVAFGLASPMIQLV